jgi:hypothetical protein|tara:strand:- start:551 stop:1459 length:909 start_codon:yes stop_codon:yes gene_type:complete
MKYTNQHNLPPVVVDALTLDDYDKGDSDLSISEMNDSVQIRLLKNQHENDIVRDVTENSPIFQGNAIHAALEKAANLRDDCISEERLFVHHSSGLKYSGAIDLQIINPDGTITVIDFKQTSVWTLILNGGKIKKEWVEQVNPYGYMVETCKGVTVSNIQIVVFLRDWKSNKDDANYPDSPVIVLDVPKWSRSKCEAHIDSRIKAFQDAKFRHISMGEGLPECSNEERWVRGEKWAVMKKGRKSAIRGGLKDTEQEAIDLVETLDKGYYYIEHRPGRNIRCEGNYCQVSQWCDQYAEIIGGRS